MKYFHTPSHAEALSKFAGRLERLLVLRSVVQLSTVAFFIFGVVVLACKISGILITPWLPLGFLGFVPLILFAALRERRRQPAFATVRANYDRLNHCGGMMMAGEAGDMGAWQSRLPVAAIPALQWQGGRMLGMLGLSVIFLATAWWLPVRFSGLFPHHALEIGGIVEQLQTEVTVLQQEKIVDDKKAGDFQKQLEQLKADASGMDPDKTWEALDHIKEADTAAATQAAEEAVAKSTSLAQAETLAQAMAQAGEAGMSDATAAQAAQNLASLMDAAKLEEGVIKGQIPPELLAGLTGLNGLNKDALAKLMQALAANKNGLSATVEKLSAHKLIDPSLLTKCQLAGQCKNPQALADYLCSCTNGTACSLAECTMLGIGGPGGGGPAAPMTWSDGVSEKDQKFQEHVLPPSAPSGDARLVGVSRAAPQLSGNDVATTPGALADATASGGSAQAQVILPEHRQAVRNFFKREP